MSNEPYAMWDSGLIHFAEGTLRREDTDACLVLVVDLAEKTLCRQSTRDMLGPDTHRNRVIPFNSDYCHTCVDVALAKESHATS